MADLLGVPAAAVAACDTVITPPCDKREYQSLVLPNGMKVLLIHDPEMMHQEEEGGGAADGADGGAPPAAAAAAAAAAVPRRHTGDSGVLTDDDDVDELVSGSEDEGGSGGSSSGDSGSSGGSDDDASMSDGSGSGGGGRGARSPRGAPPPRGAKKAAAALSVGVGHFADPDHLPGLSHYLEHMLFMGSEAFPDENEYDAFLSVHGGGGNAFTEEEATTFHLDVSPPGLRGALERFAGFFAAPLVKADALAREVRAVESEFRGVAQSDGARLAAVRAARARAGHPAAKFAWGNARSLAEAPAAAGVDVRAALLAHHARHYSADRMALVLLGAEPLPTLAGWAAELFGRVPSGAGPAPRFDGAGPPRAGGALTLLPAVRDGHRLAVSFWLPCLDGRYRAKADDYLAHLVGHEGRGSLLSALKARGWATELSAGAGEHSSAGAAFDVTLTLTEAGLAAGGPVAPGAAGGGAAAAAPAGLGLAAAALVFQYLAMLRAAGPQRWAFDEVAAAAGARFRFLEEEDAGEYAAGLAADLHRFPPAHAVAGPYLHDDWDPGLVTKLLGAMTPAAACVDLQTAAYDACAAAARSALPGAAGGREQWFGVDYTAAPLPAALLAAWAAAPPAPDLALPPRNPFMPSDFSLRCDDAGFEGGNGANGVANGSGAAPRAAPQTAPSAFPTPPALLLDGPGLRLWHKLDAAFRLPRATALARLSSAALYGSAAAGAASHLAVKLLEDALCETAYLADAAGLHFAVWFEGTQGIDLKVDGFSHKLPELARLVFSELAALPGRLDAAAAAEAGAAAGAPPGAGAAGAGAPPGAGAAGAGALAAFRRVREALARAYRNAHVKPLRHATYLRLRCLRTTLWPVEAVLAEVEAATPAGVAAHLRAVLGGGTTHLELLVHGNVTAAAAAALARAARAALPGPGPAAEARPADAAAVLPAGCDALVRRAAANPAEPNSVVEAYFQLAAPDAPPARAALDMLCQLLYEPAYDALRTKEQLGYTVHSGARVTHGLLGLAFVVQGAAHGPAHVGGRIDAFLEAFGGRLAAMPDAEFEAQRAALLALKATRDRSPGEEADRHWEAVASRRYDFGARRAEVDALRALPRRAVEELYAAALAPGGAARRKLAVHIVGAAHAAELGAPPPPGAALVADEDAFRAAMPAHRAPPAPVTPPAAPLVEP